MRGSAAACGSGRMIQDTESPTDRLTLIRHLRGSAVQWAAGADGRGALLVR